MKKIFFLFIFSCQFGVAKGNKFQEALNHLNKEAFTEAENLFSEILIDKPEWEQVRYNLAYTLYLKGEEEKALAFQRQVFFQNPYNKPIIEEDLWSLLWLYVPSDIVLAVLFLTSCVLLFFLYKKRYSAFKTWTVLWIIFHCLGGIYFYQRHFIHYATVIEDSQILSAPDREATVLFKEKAGALVKIKQTKDDFSHIQQKEKSGGWIATKALIPVKIKDVDRDS